MHRSLLSMLPRITMRPAVASLVSRSSLAAPSPLLTQSARFKSGKSEQEKAGEAAGIIRRFTPVTPGRRHLVLLRHAHLWRGRPVRALTKGSAKSGGRDRTGRIRVESRGGGHKRLYRFIDFKRSVRTHAQKSEHVRRPKLVAYVWLSPHSTLSLSPPFPGRVG